MGGMFWDTSKFDQNIGTWSMGNITNIYGMFDGASNYDQNIEAWDTGNVTIMRGMFDGASKFNKAHIKDWANNKP